MRLAFSMTARCNASCAHCSNGHGPYRTESLSSDQIIRVMNEAAGIDDGVPLQFALTGGEPFVDIEKLIRVVLHAKSLCATVSCMTNGFWATSDKRAANLMNRLRNAGLDALGVSTSRFHRKYVDHEQVRLSLSAARTAGITTTLKLAVMASDEDYLNTEDWKTLAAAADHVEYLGIVGPGRDINALDSNDLMQGPALPEGSCPSIAMLISERGRASICCSSGRLSAFHEIGDILAEGNLEAAAQAFNHGSKLNMLRSAGPAWIANQLILGGHGSLLRKSYLDRCDLCSHIGQDSRLAHAAEYLAERFASPEQNPSDALIK